jgi:hypothetical protein
MADKSTIYVIRDEEGKVIATSLTSLGMRLGPRREVAFLRPANGQSLHIADVNHKVLFVPAKQLHAALAKEKMRHIKNADKHFMEMARKIFAR